MERGRREEVVNVNPPAQADNQPRRMRGIGWAGAGLRGPRGNLGRRIKMKMKIKKAAAAAAVLGAQKNSGAVSKHSPADVLPLAAG